MLRKTYLPLFLLLLLLQAGCSEKDETTPTPLVDPAARISNLLGQWQLVKVISGFPVKATTAIVSDSRQGYQFNADSTFTFTTHNGIQATGKFSIKTSYEISTPEGVQEEREYLVLTTYQPAGFFHTLDKKVYLDQTKTNQLVESHVAYDGPMYFYQKMDDRVQK